MRFNAHIRSLLAVTRQPRFQYILRTILPVAAITIVGLLLRLYALNRQSLWFDEGVTVWKVAQPYSRLWGLNSIDTVPPLYYWLLKMWVGLWGLNDTSIRLFSALLGTATIPVVYSLGKTFFNVRTGLIASVLMTTATYHIQYSQEARSYALVTLVFALCWRFLSGSLKNGQCWLGYSMCGVLLLYSHGISLFYLAALNVYFFLDPDNLKSRQLRNWLVSNLAIGASFLPWFWTYLAQISSFQNQTHLPQPTLSGVVGTLILLGSLPPSTTGLLPVLLQGTPLFVPLIQTLWMTSFLFLLLAPLLLFSRNRDLAVYRIYVLFVLPLGLIVVYSLFWQSIYVDRLMLVSLVPLIVILSSTIDLPARRVRPLASSVLAVYVLCISFSVYAYYQSQWKEDYRGATAYLIPNLHQGDALIFVASLGEILFDWYSEGQGSCETKTGMPEGIFDRSEPNPGLTVKQKEDLRRLPEVVRNHKRIWLFKNRTYTHDPLEMTEAWLAQSINKVQTINFHGVQLVLFQH